MQRIQVGPESAGSEPGPACYGRGGTQPAVTDADLTPLWPADVLKDAVAERNTMFRRAPTAGPSDGRGWAHG